jgi:hypothetical protein
MLRRFRAIYFSAFWRAIYIVCMVMVFSYIFFDVLDLDGSDSPLKRVPVQKSVIVAETPREIKPTSSTDLAELLGKVLALFTAGLGESAWLQRMEVLRPLPFDCARARGYRVALPRSSTADSSPSV